MAKSPPRKRKPAGRASATRAGAFKFPSLIFAHASPRSLGGVSLFEVQTQVHSDFVTSFFSDDEIIRRSIMRLEDAGFQILQVSPVTINIAGTRETFEKAFKTKLTIESRPSVKELGRAAMTEFIECPSTTLPGLISTAGTNMADLIEGVAIEEARYYMAPSMFAPLKSYWHLRMPGDVSLGINADRAHRSGITGKGVKVAMVDSGHYLHPFFVGRGYRVKPVVLGPGAANPATDESGHGTGESANIFAVAPDVELQPVKMSFTNSIGAFNTAVGLGPDIITCSWGSSVSQGPLSAANLALAASISSAVAAGITVIFSAGNGHWGFPGQHPDVISAGGVFMDKDESLRASNYASGFMSNIYSGRRVPDVCGLVGMTPKAIYIMLPVEPGDEIDSTPSPAGLAGGTFPNGDETGTNDGWGAFSGTSAAAPQLAGVAALIKQACPRLTPASIKDIMRKTARDVTVGNCNVNTGANPAGPGPDLATGDGLVDAHKAVLTAKVRCLTVITTAIGPRIPPPPGPHIPPPGPRIPPPPGPHIPPPGPRIPPPPIPPRITMPRIGTPIIPPQPGPDPGPIKPGPVGPAESAAQGAALTAEDAEVLEKLVQQGDIEL